MVSARLCFPRQRLVRLAFPLERFFFIFTVCVLALLDDGQFKLETWVDARRLSGCSDPLLTVQRKEGVVRSSREKSPRGYLSSLIDAGMLDVSS